MSARRQWLIEQQLADREGQVFQLRRGALEALRLRELRDVGDRLGKELGKRFESINVGERVEGIIGRRLDLENGPYAVVERARDFTLVPWRGMFERNTGKTASGIMRTDGVS